MPFVTSIYTIPDLLTIAHSLYSLTISLGRSSIFMRMYSGHLSGVIREKLLMSIVMNHAPCIEMMLLKSIFATNMSAVGIATSPG